MQNSTCRGVARDSGEATCAVLWVRERTGEVGDRFQREDKDRGGALKLCEGPFRRVYFLGVRVSVVCHGYGGVGRHSACQAGRV